EVEINKLKERVKYLEDKEGVIGDKSGDDAPIKGRRSNEREAAAEKVSTDSEEIARVLTSLDATNVLAGETNVPTGSGSIPTAGPPSTIVSTGTPRVTSTAAEEGSMQQTLTELTNFCTSLQRQHLELLAKFQAQEVEINKLKDRVKYLEDKEGVIGDKFGDDAPIKGRRSNEGEEIARVLTSLDATNVLAGETNVPTGSGSIPTAGPPATIVSTGSEVGPTASPIHSERERNYWQIIRLGGSTACYQFFVDLLRQLDREDLNQLWALVKEYLTIRPASNDKEMELWVELKRMYEPDPEDHLWTLTQNYMHAPEWVRVAQYTAPLE
nr:hypothetical protein [Tanacetum cinerariifolium]